MTTTSPSDPDFTLPVSVFQNKDDKQPRRHDIAWHAFTERLCRYDERSVKDGRAWSPVTYLPGTTRGKANVDKVYALVLDADHAPLPMDLLEGRELAAHTTFQHTPEAPRWRGILPLSRPIDGADWPAFWLRANAYFGGCADPATKDSSRIFYLPSCPPGAQHEVIVRHGRLLDPEELPEVIIYEPPVIRGGRKKPAMSRYLADWAARFTLDRCSGLASMARDSGRNNAANRLAHLLAGLVADPVHDLREEWVEDQLMAACVRNLLVTDDGEHATRTTIRSGMDSGLQKPWSPSDQDPQYPPSEPRTDEGRRPRITAVPRLKIEVERMGNTEPEKIDWLWYRRFARGKATLLMGDPGLGKSLISTDIAARVSTGAEWPDGGRCDQGGAILFTIEDGLADTVKPRLMAAGADCNRIVAVRDVIDLEQPLDKRMFALEEHITLLKDLIEQEQANLVVLDPVTAYLGANVNAHKDADVRRVLGPLQFMAEETGVALLLLMHLTKGSSVTALYRASGSIAFPAVARIVLGVAPDPNDETGTRKLLLPVKQNLSKAYAGIGYRIESTRQHILARVPDEDQPPVIVWDDEPVLVDATSAMDRAGTVQEMGALAECKSALAQIMDAAGGRILSREGERQLKEAGASTAPAVLGRARRELKIRISKERGAFTGPWYWESSVIPRAHAGANPQTSKTSETSTPDRDHEVYEVSEEYSSRARARAHDNVEMRYCVHCMRNLPTDEYDAHEPCPEKVDLTGRVIIIEQCPVHHLGWADHDCDQL